MSSEPEEAAAFRAWLSSNGAYFHPDLEFVKDASGMSIYAAQEIPQDVKVVSCPFSLAVTPLLAKRVLTKFSGHTDGGVDILSERELICTYLGMHWILDDIPDKKILGSIADFNHLPYLRTLPSANALRTSLHFTEDELSLLRGTNLYGATGDRRSEWDTEWKRCQNFVCSIRVDLGSRFTWERYLTLSTYVSSRAFPSTLLSINPSLVPTPLSYPVLLPALDCLNHSRAHRVSWVVSDIELETLSPTPTSEPSLQVSLVIHTPTPANTEVFNNYGPKPNAELILGYGFSLPANPDDTIVLQVGGQAGVSHRRWEVGRDARGSEGLWAEIKHLVCDRDDDEISEWEVDLEVAEVLKEMTESKLRRMQELPSCIPKDVRIDVWNMVHDYVTGQKEILHSLCTFAHTKREGALIRARDDGVELVFEDEDEADETI